MNDHLPLLDRPLDAVLFHTEAGGIAGAAFLGDVQAVAAALPAGRYVLNVCRDRYAFTVAFAAAMVRGQISLLGGQGELSDVVVAYDDPALRPEAPGLLVQASGRRGGGANAEFPAAQPAALVFTSGSTGAPVAHPKAWGALVARSRAGGERFGLVETAPATIVGTVPPGHMYGFETTVLLPLHAACSSWCGPAFFPADVQSALSRVGAPRILVTTPLQLRALLQGTITGLEGCISATAPLDPALAAEAEAAWGVPVQEIYGATEAGSVASRRTTDGPVWAPYPGVAVVERDGATWVTAPHAEPVELADLIEPEPGGAFRLLGRRADMVKLGGRRASLAGLNQILTALPGVTDGAFVVPDDLDARSTARLSAIVVAPDRTGAAILAELRHRIDPVFLPRRVIHVDQMPRNALGKLPRQALLALLGQE